MCVQSYRTLKPTRPRTMASQKEKAPKQLKKVQPSLKVNAENNKENNSTQTKRRKKPKSVSFDEVVVVQPHYFQEEAEKSVSFHEVVVVRPVLHLSDYTDQEIIETWYDTEDKKRMKSEILNALKQSKDSKNSSFSSLDSCVASEDEFACTRGLERLSDGGRMRERRRISIREVLKAQEAQRVSHKSNGKPFSYDHSKFRKTYKPYSRAARHHAHAVGLMDQMAVSENTSESLD